MRVVSESQVVKVPQRPKNPNLYSRTLLKQIYEAYAAKQGPRYLENVNANTIKKVWQRAVKAKRSLKRDELYPQERALIDYMLEEAFQQP